MKSILPVLLTVGLLTTGCAALLPVGLALQGAISAGSDVVGMVKWWEDRKFQAEAQRLLEAQTAQIQALTEELAHTRQTLHEDLERGFLP